MRQRTEFPALEARKSDLQHQHYEATRQANDATYAGKPDAAAQQWLTRIREELDQLNYVLDYFELIRLRDLQGWRTWQTVVLITVAALALALSLFSVWRG